MVLSIKWLKLIFLSSSHLGVLLMDSPGVMGGLCPTAPIICWSHSLTPTSMSLFEDRAFKVEITVKWSNKCGAQIQEDLCPYLKRKRYQLTLSVYPAAWSVVIFFFFPFSCFSKSEKNPGIIWREPRALNLCICWLGCGWVREMTENLVICRGVWDQ